jgi:hypothetical protein
MRSIASRLWPERARIALAPGGVAGLGASLSALRGARSAVEITLSNRFARYLWLPWSRALRSEADWQSFAEHRFAELFGARPAGYAILLSSSAARAARLACALEPELIEALRKQVAEAGHRLISLRPRFAASFDRARRRVGKSEAWFVDQEPGQLTMALARHGEWHAIRQRHADAAWRERLSQMLDRESELAGADAVEKAFVATSESADGFPERLGRYTVLAMGHA